MASSESTADIDEAMKLVHRALDPVLADAIEASTLRSIEGTLFYVPIVMPVEMHQKYKERSRYVRKTQAYECCPHLSHAIFLKCEIENVISEYLRGLALAAPHLARLGATEEQISEFLAIIDQASARAILERRDITRQ